jgi:hypothetical protein
MTMTTPPTSPADLAGRLESVLPDVVNFKPRDSHDREDLEELDGIADQLHEELGRLMERLHAPPEGSGDAEISSGVDVVD